MFPSFRCVCVACVQAKGRHSNDESPATSPFCDNNSGKHNNQHNDDSSGGEAKVAEGRHSVLAEMRREERENDTFVQINPADDDIVSRMT
jgi:hypothetical protein